MALNNMPDFRPDLLAAWSGGRWMSQPPPLFRGIRADSRAVRPGDLFLALRGPRHDGHDYVQEAFARGAAGAVVCEDRAAATASCGPLLIVADTLAALQNLARGYRATLKADMIGVTGSAGKTTVKEMVAAVLAQRGPTAKTIGNWNNDIGLPLSLLEAPAGAQFGVFEVGMNHAGELRPLCDLLQPRRGIVTNIGPVHMEFFLSLEDIAREKSEVLRCLPADGTAVLDADGPFFAFLKKTTRARVLAIALCGEADYQGEVLDVVNGDFAVRETATGARVVLRVAAPGRHNIVNALFAVAVGRSAGASWEQIADALAAYQAPSMRWTVVEQNGVLFINDAYNANPLSMRAALETFRKTPVTGRRWLVLGGMRELGACERAEHEALGRLVAEGEWNGLVTVGALGDLIGESAAANGMPRDRIYICETHEKAAEVLRGALKAGDAVLLKASRGEALEKVLDLWQRERAPR
jgi:UDP-N-acetylmuramoyl-tripeptide--D-alanyl-D-alanine ligase